MKKVDAGGTTYTPGEHYEVKGGVVTKYYYLGGQRVAMKVGSTVYWLHGDHLGSASLTTNSSGGIYAQQRYFPYGEVRWSSGSLPTDRQYTGQRRETALGIYDYKARFYSPRLGRFVSADTIIPDLKNSQDFNRYTYVRNSPLKYRDPTGHFTEDEIKQYLWNELSYIDDEKERQNMFDKILVDWKQSDLWAILEQATYEDILCSEPLKLDRSVSSATMSMKGVHDDETTNLHTGIQSQARAGRTGRYQNCCRYLPRTSAQTTGVFALAQ